MTDGLPKVMIKTYKAWEFWVEGTATASDRAVAKPPFLLDATTSTDQTLFSATYFLVVLCSHSVALLGCSFPSQDLLLTVANS